MRALRRLAASAALLALVVGVPALFATTIGNPANGWVDLKAGDLTGPALADVLAVIVWLAWAQFTLSVALEVVAGIRRRPPPRRIPLVPGPSQHLARTLVTAVLLAGTATTAGATAATTLAHPVPAPAALTALTAVTAAPAAANQVSSSAAHRAAPATPIPSSSPVAQTPHIDAGPAAGHRAGDTLTYVVPADGSGPDTFWDIAVHFLGDGRGWNQVWELNKGRVQPDGSRMSDPDLLKAGWTVIVPTPEHAAETVIVRQGDNLIDLAKAHGTTWKTLWDLNQGHRQGDGLSLKEPGLIQPGWVLQLPQTRPRQPEPAPAATQTGAGGSTPSTPTATPPPHPQTATTAPAPEDRSTPPRVESPPTQSPENTPSAPAQGQPGSGVDLDGGQSIPVLAYTGGGLLAALLLGALVSARRRQHRHRRPGRSIAPTPTGPAALERATRIHGPARLADLRLLDEALGSLAHQLGSDSGSATGSNSGSDSGSDSGVVPPDVVAVRLGASDLELVLITPNPTAPPPWRVDHTGTRWSVRAGDDLGYDPATRDYQYPLYPALASVGYTDTGEQWLLDLERIGALSLTGDPDACLNLARYLAAELAHNTWSQALQVTLVGFGAELTQINPDRITHTADLAQTLSALTSQLDTVEAAAAESGTDVLTGRLRNTSGDACPPHIALIAPSTTGDEQLRVLLNQMRHRGARSATAVVLAGDQTNLDATRWQLTLDAHGGLSIPALDLHLHAHQIPAEEANLLAQMLTAATDLDDTPTPRARTSQPWDRVADATGNLTPTTCAAAASTTSITGPPHLVGAVRTQTTPDSTRQEEATPPARSLLPLPAADYLDATATTPHDLSLLAPPVDEQTRRAVEAADPHLDQDLADWADPTCPRPKISVLGPVLVRASGTLPSQRPRLAWYTEVITYLASRGPNGASTAEYAAALWPGDPDAIRKVKVRESIRIARAWLGANPRTGTPFIPMATSAGTSGRYRVDDALTDAELFRRLRLRAHARGTAGIDDLQAAVDLVRGEPFDQQRLDGYGWLTETPLDHEYTAMIIDVAHLVSTHHLAAGHPEPARQAARKALLTNSFADAPLLDMLFAADAEGNDGEARTWYRKILNQHDAEIPEDLPPRTAQILFRRERLLGQAS